MTSIPGHDAPAIGSRQKWSHNARKSGCKQAFLLVRRSGDVKNQQHDTDDDSGSGSGVRVVRGWRCWRAAEPTASGPPETKPVQLKADSDDWRRPLEITDSTGAELPRLGTGPKDMERSRAWTSRWLSGPASLPVSFLLDGKAVAGIPADWEPVSKRRRIDANIVETIFEGRDAKTGLSLRVECAEYLTTRSWNGSRGSATRGTSRRPSSATSWPWTAASTGSSPVLQHGNGDFYSEQGYTQQETPLDKDASCRFAPSGGRRATRRSPTTASRSRSAACPSRSAGRRSGRPLSADLPTACTSAPARRRPICG